MGQVTPIRPNDIERPVLDLSADSLRLALQQMVAGSEEHGGVERYVDAVKLKSDMFQQALEQIITPFRNANLNETPPFDQINPTAELVAKHIGDTLDAMISSRVLHVRLTEAPGCVVRYWPKRAD